MLYYYYYRKKYKLNLIKTIYRKIRFVLNDKK